MVRRSGDDGAEKQNSLSLRDGGSVWCSMWGVFLSSSLKAHLPYISPAPRVLSSFTHRCRRSSPFLSRYVQSCRRFSLLMIPFFHPLRPWPRPHPPWGLTQAMGTETWINRLAPPRSLPPLLLHLLAVFVWYCFTSCEIEFPHSDWYWK